MTWSQERRLDYIDLLLREEGRVRRADIQRAFGVTQGIASRDLATFEAAHPGVLRYDKSAKQYVPARGRYGAVRTTPATRSALRLLTAG